MKKIILTLIVGLIVLSGANVMAQVSTTFDVTANVAASCAINSMQDMTFGAYDAIGGDVNATATLDFKCTKNTAYDIWIEGLPGTPREMAGATDNLSYDLYYDNTYTQVWASATGNILGQGSTPDNTDQTVTVYGQIPGGQNVAVDNYTQTLAITVNY